MVVPITRSNSHTKSTPALTSGVEATTLTSADVVRRAASGLAVPALIYVVDLLACRTVVDLRLCDVADSIHWVALWAGLHEEHQITPVSPGATVSSEMGSPVRPLFPMLTPRWGRRVTFVLIRGLNVSGRYWDRTRFQYKSGYWA